MVLRKISHGLGLLAALAMVLVGAGPAAAASQSSFDTIRIEENGSTLPYQVWVAWSPTLIATPDGGAWAFFSAQTVHGDNSLGTKKLYTSRFDPATATWKPANAVKGGQIQFGAAAVIDGQGTVHVVFTDRQDDKPASFGGLMYMKSTPEGGWTDPVAVAANASAGHQLSPEMAIDKNGVIHLVWQDQRSVDQASRDAAASNADVFSSEQGTDGAWSNPVQMSAARPDPATNASRAQVALDGDRLVAIWSVYTKESGLNSAARIEWSTKPIDGSSGWAAPQTLVDQAGTQIGGRLVDLAADPTGGVDIVYGRHATAGNTISTQKLGSGANQWTTPANLVSGDRGSFPSTAVGGDGTLYATYNIGSGTAVGVGSVALQSGAVRASSEVNLTAGDDGAQGRATIEVTGSGRLWVIYLHEPNGGVSNEIRVLRGAVIPSEPGPEATPVPAAAGTPVAVSTPAA